MSLPPVPTHRERTVQSHSEPSASPGSSIYIVALIIAVAMLGVGIYLAIEVKNWALLAAGATSVVVVLATWPLAQVMIVGRSEALRRQDALTAALSAQLKDITVLLNVVTEQQLLSDRAKSVAFRDKDRDALRRAIKEDLSRRDWEAALVLVNDMERTFGYAHEAVQFKQEINAHRDEVVRRDVAETTTKVENFCRAEKWVEAQHEADRVIALYPTNEQALRIPADIEIRRQNMKKQLVDSWNDAVGRKDVDTAIEVLKKLDTYLTRPEAEGIQETVRGVFREKVNQLGAGHAVRPGAGRRVDERDVSPAERACRRSFVNARFVAGFHYGKADEVDQVASELGAIGAGGGLRILLESLRDDERVDLWVHLGGRRLPDQNPRVIVAVVPLVGFPEQPGPAIRAQRLQEDRIRNRRHTGPQRTEDFRVKDCRVIRTPEGRFVRQDGRQTISVGYSPACSCDFYDDAIVAGDRLARLILDHRGWG